MASEQNQASVAEMTPPRSQTEIGGAVTEQDRAKSEGILNQLRGDEKSTAFARQLREGFNASGNAEASLNTLARDDIEQTIQDSPSPIEGTGPQTPPTAESLAAQGINVDRLQQVQQTGEMQDHRATQDLPPSGQTSETPPTTNAPRNLDQEANETWNRVYQQEMQGHSGDDEEAHQRAEQIADQAEANFRQQNNPTTETTTPPASQTAETPITEPAQDLEKEGNAVWDRIYKQEMQGKWNGTDASAFDNANTRATRIADAAKRRFMEQNKPQSSQNEASSSGPTGEQSARQSGAAETIRLPDYAHIQWKKLGVEMKKGRPDIAGVPSVVELRRQQNALYNENLRIRKDQNLTDEQRQQQTAAVEQQSQDLYTQFARDNRDLVEAMAKLPATGSGIVTESFVQGLERVRAEEAKTQGTEAAPQSPEQQLASARTEFLQIYDANNRPPNDNPDTQEYKAWASDRDRKADLYARAMVERQTLEQNANRSAAGENASGTAQETLTQTNQTENTDRQTETPTAREIPPSAQRLYDRADEMRGRADNLRTRADEMDTQAQTLRQQAEAMPPDPPRDQNEIIPRDLSQRERLLADAKRLENRARSMRNRAENLDRLADTKEDKGKKKEEQAEAKKQEAIRMREEQGKELGKTMEQAMKELGFDAKKPMTLAEQRQMLQRALEITNDKVKNAKGNEKRKLLGILRALGLLVAGAVVLAGSLLTEQGANLAGKGEQMRTAVTG